MAYTGRGRNYLTKSDKEEIKRRIQSGERPDSVATYYDISEFAARKIAGLVLE